jgi:hypothetical protein
MPFFAPSAKALEHAVPIAELLGQIAPRRSGSNQPEHSIHKQTIVLAVPTSVSLFTWNKRLNTPPLRVRKRSMPNQDRPPQFRS